MIAALMMGASAAPTPAGALDCPESSLDVTHAQPHRELLLLASSTPEHAPVSTPATASRRPRKPSPGLAARLTALAFAKYRDSSPKPTSSAPGTVGRIPEHHIRQLDSLHRANSTRSVVERRGRAWSGTSSKSAPQIVGDGSTGFAIDEPVRPGDELSALFGFISGDTRIVEVSQRTSYSSAGMTNCHEVDMESHKYRLPDHDNGNGTKATLATKMAHINRDDSPPPPPPISKQEPPGPETPSDFSNVVQSYFNPLSLQRAGSIYTLSRVSFADQLAQLTSLQLPDAESLSSKVSAIPTSQAAAKALTNAADQIRSWISKASEVLGGLDADDDVEWAAAGGREGLDDVDNAIVRFEELINVYVSAIEELQNRKDVTAVPSDELKDVVTQVETIVNEWEDIRQTLTDVKSQVGVAIEWEELWNIVLGDIGNEMDILSRLVFEMEEKRHRSLMAEAESEGVDLGDLETIVEETHPPATRAQARKRFSVMAAFPMSPNSPHTPTMAQDDSSLLALFARMQPLRASLDFLPIRLSAFHARADKIFPTGCAELETRREGLEGSWKRLENDAETLRRELGEDRWVLVFRGAGRQAQKMYESVERSITKLQEGIDAGGNVSIASALGKKIESYETKKVHYGPAIDRVLSIIEKGVHDRLTVNGEIVRLHADMQGKWEGLKQKMIELDLTLDELETDNRNQQLRDSISSLMSNDMSVVESQVDTPGSSPASSVIVSNLQAGTDLKTPARNGNLRQASESSLPKPTTRANTTTLTGSASKGQISKKPSTTRLSPHVAGATPSMTSRESSATPTGNRLQSPLLSLLDNRPRWNSSVHIDDSSFKPLTIISSLAGRPGARVGRSISEHTPFTKESRIPLRSPHRANAFSSPILETTPSQPNFSSGFNPDDTIASPTSNLKSQYALLSPSTRPRPLQNQSALSNLGSSRRISLHPSDSSTSSPLPRPTLSNGPSSSAGTNRRSSMLPQPRGRPDSSVTGRESPQAVAGAVMAMRRNSSQTSMDSRGVERPRWR